ncbi:hypothetical protein ALUC_50114A [Aspergillus luchuensis]|nr:hypothetical protein ALUC_50114A [Aspergillus luchuensis]
MLNTLCSIPRDHSFVFDYHTHRMSDRKDEIPYPRRVEAELARERQQASRDRRRLGLVEPILPPENARLVQTTANIRAFEEGDPHYYTTSSETSSQRQAVQVQDSQGADIPNDSDGTESELEFHVDEYRDEIYEDMSKPVLFYGKDNQLEDVITYCTLRFLTDDAFDDNDKRKSAYLGTLLRGPALRWLSKEQSVDPEIYDDYQEFVKKVRTAFAKTEKTKIQEASRRITFLTQKSSVQAYYVAFQRDAEELS